MTAPSLRVIVVTYDSGAHVADTLAAVSAQLRPGDELRVVDNASRDDTLRRVAAAAPDATVLAESENLGFAAGCHAGAEGAATDLLLFLNPDARPSGGCLDALRAGADHATWGAWQALVTLPGGREVNTAGGVTHFLGLGWAGGHGEPVGRVAAAPVSVSFASGAALVVRRALWEELGGFDPEYFMYGEDVDLSLRLRLAGWEVGRPPGAIVEHTYEFGKGSQKWFLLERNRWLTVLSVYPARLLLLLAPALVAAEVALLAVAAREGWLPEKLRAQRALVRMMPWVLRRRRRVGARRAVDAATFAQALDASLSSPFFASAARHPVVQAVLGGYWRAVRAALGPGGGPQAGSATATNW